VIVCFTVYVKLCRTFSGTVRIRGLLYLQAIMEQTFTQQTGQT
jgi:hypothetical protein